MLKVNKNIKILIKTKYKKIKIKPKSYKINNLTK